MPLDYAKIMSLPPREIRASYSRRDTILYALGLGVGAENPCDGSELRFVYEQDLVCLPTMAVVLGGFGFWLQQPQYGVDWKRVLHGEQSLEIHRPLPVEGDLSSVLVIDEIYDKGAEKGALLYSTRRLFHAPSGAPLATLRQSSFLRGDGGFRGKRDGAPRPHALPQGRESDHVVEIRTRIDQALIYRLSGDYNPLHVDPAVATAAGFDRPILHGLCSYGIVGRSVLRALCTGRADALRRLDVRFSSPVYPGETLRTEIWREAPGTAALRTTIVERGVVAIDNGYVEYVEGPGEVAEDRSNG
jgi:acyl dehydratase